MRLALLLALWTGVAAADAPALQAFAPHTASLWRAGVRPAVVAVWRLDCVHCETNLAVVGRLARRERVRVITLAEDPLGQTPAILAKLARAGVQAEAYAFGEAAPDHLRYTLDPTWRGELPRTFFLRADGSEVAVSGLVNDTRVLELLGLPQETE